MKRLPAGTAVATVGDAPPKNKGGGVLGNKGGGGPTQTFQRRMQLALRRARACVVTEQAIAGELPEFYGTTKDGERIYGPTKPQTRLNAIELASRIGHGLPASGTQVTSLGPLQIVVVAE